MGFKEELAKEREELKNVKRPYETAAFLIFFVFFVQQLFYIVLNFFDFLKRVGERNDWVDLGNTTYTVNFSFGSKGSTPNIPAFVTRVLSIDSSKFIWILMAFAFLALWYFLIYLLVWNYCKKRGLAKWTWTALIAYGPANVLLIPVYLIYALYVFRPYVFRFVRRGVEEYKKYNVDFVFNEDVEDPLTVKEEPKEKVKEEPKEEKEEA